MELLRACIERQEGFDADDSPGLQGLHSQPGFETLVQQVRARFPKVHHAQVAITTHQKDLVPEGLASDPARDVLYMSSLNLRKIVRVSRDGDVSDLVNPGQDGLGPVCGVKVDPTDHSVWANTCQNDGNGAALFHISASGRVLEHYGAPSGGKHLFNDLVLANPQAIYLTDSLANLVYRFDRKEHSFNSLTLSRPVLYPNGIAISDDERLIYVADAFGVLVLDLRTKAASELAPAGHTLAGADGLYWSKESLIAVQNGIGSARVTRFRLSADGKRVTGNQILEHRTELVKLPTTGALEGDNFYFMCDTQLDNFRDGKIVDPGKLEPIRIAVVRLEDHQPSEHRAANEQ
jgi:hypothetical protein